MTKRHDGRLDELDETGMPVHVPMGLTWKGEGPANDSEAVTVACWCPKGPECDVIPPRPGPAALLPIYFATVRQTGFDPHDLGRKMVSL